MVEGSTASLVFFASRFPAAVKNEIIKNTAIALFPFIAFLLTLHSLARRGLFLG